MIFNCCADTYECVLILLPVHFFFFFTNRGKNEHVFVVLHAEAADRDGFMNPENISVSSVILHPLVHLSVRLGIMWRSFSSGGCSDFILSATRSSHHSLAVCVCVCVFQTHRSHQTQRPQSHSSPFTEIYK